jgi:hypothetical protein
MTFEDMMNHNIASENTYGDRCVITAEKLVEWIGLQEAAAVFDALMRHEAFFIEDCCNYYLTDDPFTLGLG